MRGDEFFKRSLNPSEEELRTRDILDKAEEGIGVKSFVPVNEDEFVRVTTGAPLDQELVKQLRPINSFFTPEEWLLMAPIMGITQAWSKDFMEYRLNLAKTGKSQRIGPDRENPGMFWKVYYGKLGEEACKETGTATKEGMMRLAQTGKWRWSLDDLGLVGQWIKESGLDPRFAKEIVLATVQD
ncbi:hypothetical protein HY415_01255 [Candidatus Kaiserbacteria bacterium]|nr:hypothetical protein [Candidatus Kaiserbacteria bacterium]